jgi:small subunit ribosomal protein S20
LANSKSAWKRVRQNQKRRDHNVSLRSMMRTSLKKVLKLVLLGDKDKAKDAFKVAEKALDGFADKGLIHKNKAARQKSRLSAKIKAMAAK